MAQSQKYTWVVPHTGVGILAFSLAGLVVPSILTFSIGRPAAGTGIAIFSMIVFVVICMATECSGWPRWRRITFVPIAWILHAVLSIPALFTVGIAMKLLGFNYLIDSSANFAASLPIVLFAMRKSRIFVTSQARHAPRASSASENGGPISDGGGRVRGVLAEEMDHRLIGGVNLSAERHEQSRPDDLLGAAAPIAAEGRAVAEDLYLCGERGAAALAVAMAAVGQRTGMKTNAAAAKQSYLVHAHALVWFAISSHLPAAEGKPLMQAHLDALRAHLVDEGVSVPISELEATIGDQWMAYVRRPEAAGGQLIALASVVLESYVPADRLAVGDALGVAEAITGVVKGARDILVPVVAR